MNLENELKCASENIPTITDSLNKKIYSKAITEAERTKIYSLKSYRSVINLCIVFCVVFLLTLGFVLPFVNNNSGLTISAYTNNGKYFKLEKLNDESTVTFGKYSSSSMNIYQGIPMIFDFKDLTIELSVDYGQFFLDPSRKLFPEEGDGNNTLGPVPDYDEGFIYLEKHYIMHESTTIYWNPKIPSIPKIISGEYDREYLESIEPFAYNAIINYKTFKGEKVIESGIMIIEFVDGYYTVTLKKNK